MVEHCPNNFYTSCWNRKGAKLSMPQYSERNGIFRCYHALYLIHFQHQKYCFCVIVLVNHCCMSVRLLIAFLQCYILRIITVLR